MRIHRLALVSLLLTQAVVAQIKPWSETAADAWYARQPWLVGGNYIPATAINELEMWQADSFDPKRIDMELDWAESIGINSMRVFLHDPIWQLDAAGFQKRIGEFLCIADKHHIKPIFVLFDSCWDPFPKPGKQLAPKPGVHNSGWMQSPDGRLRRRYLDRRFRLHYEGAEERSKSVNDYNGFKSG